MIVLLAALGFAADVPEIQEVPSGEIISVEGPAVFMTASRFRRYVADSRNLPLCEKSLETALAEVFEANDRTLKMRDLVEEELKLSDDEDAEQVQTIADQSARIESLNSQLVQARTQRNVAWAVAGGFLAAAATAAVLTLAP